MTIPYRVLDLRIDPENPIEIAIPNAKSPEHAALLATSENLVRSGHRRDLRVRVYFQQEGQPMTMVRLYRRIEDRV